MLQQEIGPRNRCLAHSFSAIWWRRRIRGRDRVRRPESEATMSRTEPPERERRERAHSRRGTSQRPTALLLVTAIAVALILARLLSYSTT
jgi:hypothetical protein